MDQLKIKSVTLLTKPPMFRSKLSSERTDQDAIDFKEVPGEVGYDGRVYGMLIHSRLTYMSYRAEDLRRGFEEYLKPGQHFYFDAGHTQEMIALDGRSYVESLVEFGILSQEEVDKALRGQG